MLPEAVERGTAGGERRGEFEVLVLEDEEGVRGVEEGVAVGAAGDGEAELGGGVEYGEDEV